MAETATTINDRFNKIERIANGLSLDTLTYLMRLLTERQAYAREVLKSKGRKPVEYINEGVALIDSINNHINELLITKI